MRLMVSPFIPFSVKVLKVQSWYRMLRHRRPFLEYCQKRYATKRAVFVAWAKVTWADKRNHIRRLILPFTAWRNETRFRRTADVLVSKILHSSLAKGRITPFSCWAFFNVLYTPCKLPCGYFTPHRWHPTGEMVLMQHLPPELLLCELNDCF